MGKTRDPTEKMDAYSFPGMANALEMPKNPQEEVKAANVISRRGRL
jgi:hypothetical protein